MRARPEPIVHRRAALIGAGAVLGVPAAAWGDGCSRFGRYAGRIQTVWEPGIGKFRAVRAVTFIEPCGKRWAVPANAVFTGESIPGFLWLAIGSPLTGLFQDATLFHDYFCATRTEPAAAVHAMFYDALLASGVATWTAAKFYYGVKLGGPSWDALQVANARLATAPPSPRGFRLATGSVRPPASDRPRQQVGMAAPSAMGGATTMGTRGFRIARPSPRPSSVVPPAVATGSATSIAPPPAAQPGTTPSTADYLCTFAGQCDGGATASVGTGGDRALAEARAVVDRNAAAAEQFAKMAPGIAAGRYDRAQLDAAAASARAAIERQGWSAADRLAWEMAAVGAPR